MDGVRKYVEKVDSSCKDRGTGDSAGHFAARNGNTDMVSFLVNKELDLNIQNEEGNTPLHEAAFKNDKIMILHLLMKGANAELRNKKGQLPGEDSKELTDFISNMAAEHRAFDKSVLTDERVNRLRNIFEAIDSNYQGFINFEKSFKFNKWVEEVPDVLAEKDARVFLKSCALCNKDHVTFIEWCFAFAKLIVVEEKTYDKFLNDYEIAVADKGKLQDFKLNPLE